MQVNEVWTIDIGLLLKYYKFFGIIFALLYLLIVTNYVDPLEKYFYLYIIIYSLPLYLYCIVLYCIFQIEVKMVPISAKLLKCTFKGNLASVSL